MSEWPADLPEQPLLQGFGDTEQEATIRSSMDAGPAKVRTRFTATTKTLTVAYLLTAALYETLMDFYRANRSSAFTWPRPRTGEPVQARFLGCPQLRPAGGGKYYVSCNMEVLP